MMKITIMLIITMTIITVGGSSPSSDPERLRPARRRRWALSCTSQALGCNEAII